MKIRQQSILESERSFYYKKDWNRKSFIDVLFSFLNKGIQKSNDVTVIIPVCNAAEEFRNCIYSVQRNTSSKIKILLVNDCSEDEELLALLEKIKQLGNFQIINNEKKLGYTKSINIGIRSCNSDVILLNSDTEVTPKWVENLQRCAYSSSKVGTVTPLSNNSGAFSAPVANKPNKLPSWSGKDSIATAIFANSSFLYPEIPTGNGFCLYIKRSLIDNIGYFDDALFPKGYGEENDFCLRARKSGWKNLLDDSSYIFHERSASFKNEKSKLIAKAKSIIDRKYPYYQKEVKSFHESKLINLSRHRIKEVFENVELTFQLSKPSILYVLHESSGGTPSTSRDLAKTVEHKYRILFFTSDRKTLYLYLFLNGEKHLLHKWELAKSLYPSDFSNKKYKQIAHNILINYNIRIVHVRHLIYHTYDFIYQAKELGIKTILSFHDFYFICPTIHLLDENNIYCNGICSKTEGEGKTPYDFSKRITKLKNNWVNEWKNKVSTLIDQIDYFITTSQFTKEVYVKNYPKLKRKNFEIIVYGRDFFHTANFVPKCEGSKIKILCPGNLGNNKGIEFISRLIDFDKDQKIEIHTLGSLSKEALTLLKGRTINHGKYDREDFHLFVNKIKPNFVGIFSIWPATYCHTLTEAWSCGIPVLINSIGTLRERLHMNGGGGWEIKTSDVPYSYQRIIDNFSDEEKYIEQVIHCEKALNIKLGIMSKCYLFIYRKLESKDSHSCFLYKSETISNKVIKLALIVPNEYASYYIRIKNQLSNKYVHNRIFIFKLKIEEFITSKKQLDIDFVLVQRHAISTNYIKYFEEIFQNSKFKIIYEIDDDLLALKCSNYSSYQDSIKFLLRNALLTTVSTERLKKKILPLSNTIKVIPNYINEQLWGRITINEPSPRKTVNILYMGTKTHDLDLELVLPALRECHDSHSIKLVLIGISDKVYTDSFIEYRVIPKEWQHYPFFVKWLKSQRMQFDFGIAPLTEEPLNQSKSMLKFLDYSALGIAGIFSKVGPYKEIRNYENGIVIKNTNENWRNALTELIQDKGLRRKIAYNAVHHVKQNHLLESNPYALYNLLNSMTS